MRRVNNKKRKIERKRAQNTVVRDYKGFLRVLALSTMTELFAWRGINWKYPKSYLPFPWSYPSAPFYFLLLFHRWPTAWVVRLEWDAPLWACILRGECAPFFPPGEMSRSLISEALPRREAGGRKEDREKDDAIDGWKEVRRPGVGDEEAAGVCWGHQSVSCVLVCTHRERKTYDLR